MTISLCFITMNEIVGVRHDLPMLDRSMFQQIYCVDGGSTDGTVEYFEEQGIQVYRQTAKGLNQACKEAIRFCTCDAVVFFHPKGTVPVEDAYRMRTYFEEGYELVVASRMMRDSLNEEDRFLLRPRKWFGLWLGFFAKTIFRKEGNVIWDVLHGFRGITIEAFNKMSISDFNPSIDIEMVCRSYKLKIKRIEFPTQESPRLGGKTHFGAFSTGRKLLAYFLWEIWRGI